MTRRQIGPFLVDRQLGAGGMGIVYLATHTPTGKRVALKVLTPALSSDVKLLKRFEREIDILKRMSHPNIVRYYGGGTQDNQRYYAMEFIDGGSLQDILKKRRTLTWEQTIQVGRQLCSALEHAHNAGIIHRDLKPANLFISRRGRLKLGDFGIARDTEATALTAAGKTVGTYAYMAPEQIHGNAPISRKTDLYATGCLLFESLTGETPFIGDNPAEMLMQHLNDDPRNTRELVPSCPIWLDALIERLLAKDPDDRPHDALAVHTELTTILQKMKESQVIASSATMIGGGGATVQTANESANGKTAKKKKKKKRDQGQFYEQAWFLGICLALVIAATVWFSMPPGEAARYLAAKEGWSSTEESVQRDVREKVMLPYLQDFPEGKYRAEIQDWADRIQMKVLDNQAENRVRFDRSSDDPLEKAYDSALKAERDEKRNPLEAIELYHELKERLKEEPAIRDHANSRFMLLLVDERVQKNRQKLLENPKCQSLIHERLSQADPVLRSSNESPERMRSAEAIVRHFRDVFIGEPAVGDFYDYARRILSGQVATLPQITGAVPLTPPQ